MAWGTWIRSLCAGALVALGGCTTADVAEKPPADCHLSVLAEFPARVTRGRTILIPGTINGHDVSFIVDTGSSHTDLFSFALPSLGISTFALSDGGRAMGVGGSVAMSVADVKSLSIGTLPVARGLRMDVLMMGNSTNASGTIPPGTPVGILGNDFFSSTFDLEFDLADRKIFLIDQNHCAGQIKHWDGILVSSPFTMSDERYTPLGYKIEVPVTVGQKTVTAVLDSGAGRTYMTWRVAERLGITKQTPGVTQTNVTYGVDGHPIVSYKYVIPALTIGDETLPDIAVRIGDVSAWTGGIASNLFLLGADFLQKNRVYIAYKERELYFTPYKFRYSDGKPGS